MKPLTVSCLVLVCLMFVLTIQVQAERITFDPGRLDSTGNPVQSKMISIGVESSGSTDRQLPIRCLLISGVLDDRTPADSVIYVFASPAAKDSVLVESFLSSFHSPSPREWAKIGGRGARFASLFELGAFIGVPVSEDGKFIFVVDEQRYPKMTRMTIVDSGGRILARRSGLAERR